MMLLSLLMVFLADIFPPAPGGNDTLAFTNHVFSDRIKTVQLYKEGWNLSYPVIRLNSNEKLVLHFDLLGDNIEDFYYYIRCLWN